MFRHTKALSLAIGTVVLGQTCFVSAVEISLSAETSYTNNAIRTATNTRDERQDTLRLRLGHAEKWNNADLSIGYELAHQRFNQDTQTDSTSLTGSTAVSHTGSTGLRVINLRHTASLVNRSATGNGLGSDTEQKHSLHADIGTVVATSGIHSFSVSPSADATFYTDDSSLNSNELGLATLWEARLDPITMIGAGLQAKWINYKVANDSDQYTATAFYRRNLRKLQYGIEAGVQRRTQTGSDITSPYLSINGSYQAGAHALALSLRNQITDTSTGTALRSDEGELVATGTSVEQLVQRELRLTHDYSELCARCDNSTSIALSQQDYETANANDSETMRLSHNFGYKLSELATASVGLALAKTNFDNTPANDFTETVLDLGYSRQITREFSLRAYAQQSTRDSDTSTADFTESRIGVGIAYSFM